MGGSLSEDESSSLAGTSARHGFLDDRSAKPVRRDSVLADLMQVFTNPNNPLGRTYPKETILAVAKFAQERDMYLVVNEIYANSVYDNEGEFGRFPPWIDREGLSEISFRHSKEVSLT